MPDIPSILLDKKLYLKINLLIWWTPKLPIAESDDGSRFMVYYRWGRVGVKGQNKLSEPYTSQQAAINEFENKFYDKTRNNWCDRRNFVSYPRSYTWLEMDYSESKNEPAVSCFILNEIILFLPFVLLNLYLHNLWTSTLYYVKLRINTQVIIYTNIVMFVCSS